MPTWVILILHVRHGQLVMISPAYEYGKGSPTYRNTREILPEFSLYLPRAVRSLLHECIDR